MASTRRSIYKAASVERIEMRCESDGMTGVLPERPEAGARYLLRMTGDRASKLRIMIESEDGRSCSDELVSLSGMRCINVPRSADGGCAGRVLISVVEGGFPLTVELMTLPLVPVEVDQLYASAVVCGLASIPSRADALERVVEALKPQVDHLFVYLNGFSDVPGFLFRGGITVFRSQDFGDYRDNSKFFGLPLLDEDVYFLSVDDDIDYPPDYVATLVDKVEKSRRRALVGVHGAIYGAGSKMFVDRAVFHFKDAVDIDLPVSVLGTGTLAFHTSAFSFDSLAFDEVGMADLVVASLSRAQEIPSLVVSRPAGWLSAIEVPSTGVNLFAESIVIDSAHDRFVRRGGIPGPGWIRGQVQAGNPGLSLLVPDARALVEYMCAIEDGADLLALAVSGGEALRKVAYSLNWPGLLLAIVRGALVNFWSERAPAVNALCGVRSASVGVSVHAGRALISHVERVVRRADLRGPTTDEPVMGLWECAAADSAVAMKSGDHDLAAAITVLRLLESTDGDSVLDLVRQLCEAGMDEDARILVHEMASRSHPTAADAELEFGKMRLRAGFVGEILERAPAFISYGQAGKQLVALAGLMEGEQWAEDLALGVLVDARGPRGQRRARELTKAMRRVPLAKCHSELWADSMPRMPTELRVDAASVVLSNGVWSPRIEIQSLGIRRREDEVLWRAASCSDHPAMEDLALSAINSVFAAGNLCPVGLADAGGATFFDRLRAAFPTATAPRSHGLVSVVMSAFNAQDTIDYALRSIVEQTYRDIEIIIVDDCSDVPLVLPEWALVLDRVKIHRTSHNVGPYEGRNIAISMASGRFIATHDADDWMHPQKIEFQISRLTSGNAVASYTRHVRLQADGRPALENHGGFVGDGPITSMFHRQVFEDVGEFMPVRTRGDMEFKARVASRYKAARILHDDLVALLALDSATSNSKRFTSTARDELEISRFKRWYAIEHPMGYFRQKAAVPTAMSRLFS